MRKLLFTSAVLFCILPHSIAQLNIEFLGQLSYGSDQLSNLCGWADGMGNEYAIVGTEDGTSIVDVTDPTTPVEVQFVDGENSIWREIRVWDHYAYVVTEGGGGLLCIDLSGLPDDVDYNFTDGGVDLSSGHTVFCDENGIVHVFGSNLENGGDQMFDANIDPMDPPFVGEVETWYIHDGYVRGDTLWAGNIYNGWFSVWDISDKSSPALLATQNTPDNFTHNMWLSDNGDYLYTTDEVTNAVVASYDVSDLSDIQELDEIRANPGTNSIPHNTYTVGNFQVTAYYRDGVAIFDATHPDVMVKTGEYDTSPLSGDGFNGCWGAWPYLPSGIILATDMEEGLFVLGPTYVQACYLTGHVTDVITSASLFGATITITGEPDAFTSTDILGDYSTGIATAATYDVTIEKGGYFPQTLSVTLENGVTTTLDVALEPIPSAPLTGHVYDNVTGLGIEGASVLITNGSLNYEAITNASGAYSFPTVFEGTYTVYAGNWGYMTASLPDVAITTGSDINSYLTKGYYDDFIFDFGWAGSIDGATTGAWELGEPQGTLYEGAPSNPDLDVADDFGEDCYVTGNGGGASGDDDVDGGYVILKSPIFDLSSYSSPHIKYNKWFFNDGGTGTPNDTLYFYISNGTDEVLIEELDNSLVEEGTWLNSDLIVSDYISLSSSMQFTIKTGDIGPLYHIVEAAIDKFYIVEGSIVAPSANFSSDVEEVCEGSSVSFEDLSSDAPSSWAWTFEGGIPSTSTLANPIVTYDISGTYSVSLTVSNAAGSDEVVLDNYITVNDLPVLSTTTGTGTATVSITGGTAPYEILWSDPSGQTTETATGLEVGTYTVTVTDANGCSQTATANVQSVSIHNLPQGVSLNIYPNPFTESVSIAYQNDFWKELYLQVESVDGRIIYSSFVKPGETKLSTELNNLADGIYSFRFYSEGTCIAVEKIIKANN